MKFIIEIARLRKDPNEFALRFFSALQRFNARNDSDFTYSEHHVRRIARDWAEILKRDYDFGPADFCILLEDILGDFFRRFALSGNKAAYSRGIRPVDDLLNEIGPTYIALEMAFSLMRDCFLSAGWARPTPDQFKQAAIVIARDPKRSKDFWHLLGLPIFWIEKPRGAKAKRKPK